VTTQSPNLTAQPRSVLGKKVKALRRTGVTPLHLYGPGIPSLALQADTRILVQTLTEAGRSRPIDVQVEDGGGRHLAFVRDIQFHAVSGEILHVDLVRVDVAAMTRVEVPMELFGEAPAVRLRGGSLIQVLHSVLLEAMPLEIPEYIMVDVSGLEDFDDVLRVADIVVPEGITVLTDPDQMVAHATPPVGEAALEAEQAAEAEPERVTAAREGEEEAVEDSESEEES
jgi:large subunit ribosomal protein L25